MCVVRALFWGGNANGRLGRSSAVGAASRK
jgi:hypothetical protein